MVVAKEQGGESTKYQAPQHVLAAIFFRYLASLSGTRLCAFHFPVSSPEMVYPMISSTSFPSFVLRH